MSYNYIRHAEHLTEMLPGWHPVVLGLRVLAGVVLAIPLFCLVSFPPLSVLALPAPSLLPSILLSKTPVFVSFPIHLHTSLLMALHYY